MRKATYHHMYGAGGDWEGQVIEVDFPEEEVGSRYTNQQFSTFAAYRNGEKGRVYLSELTWLDADWIIEDWMGNRVFPERVFDSFEDARDFISVYADEVSDGDDYEYDTICEDLYAVQIKEEN